MRGTLFHAKIRIVRVYLAMQISCPVNPPHSSFAVVQVSRAMKTLVSRADEDTLLPALTHEHEVFSSLWGNPENTQAVHKGGANR
jgi:hypothetical protein